jgi:hypothetical protein
MNVIQHYSTQLHRQEEIVLLQYGLDYAGDDQIFDGKIHKISLGYGIDQGHLSEEQATQLFYHVVDTLIERLNGIPSLRAYFAHFPLNYSDFTISLSLDYKMRGDLGMGAVSTLYIQGDRLTYEIVDKEGPPKIVHEETSPGIFVLKEMLPNTRSITKELPHP